VSNKKNNIESNEKDFHEHDLFVCHIVDDCDRSDTLQGSSA